MTRFLPWELAVWVLAAAALGGAAWLGGPGDLQALGAAQVLFLAGALSALIGTAGTIRRQRQRLWALQRLEIALRAVLAADTSIALGNPPADFAPPLTTLWRLAAALSTRRSPQSVANQRLSSILAALPQPIIVITDQGLVTLANQPAIDLFGGDRLKPGTSVFDVIDRSSLAGQMQDSDGVKTVDLTLSNGSHLKARIRLLPNRSGMVIVMEEASHGGSGLVQALDLHEAAPPRLAPRPDTPLEVLDVMVLDCETTGLNVGFDRLLSLAAVRVHGTRLVRNEMIDVLIDPGEAIPAASTAIHGITDAMAMAAQPLAEQWSAIEPMLRECVVVGHNIGFDLTLLEIELRRAGIRWQRPMWLCTAQLASALDPQLQDLNLEAVAEAYGIAVTGRHTALGDALVTAEVYLHLLALMQAKGDRTLADAQARAGTARRVIRQQQAAGW